MSTLKTKIDFVALITVTNANPNGDPLNGNRPRTDYDGYGEMSPDCIKRKIRNRMQDMLPGIGRIFLQTEERCDDGFKSLNDRAVASAKEFEMKLDSKNADAFAEKACEKWIDVRSFGQVFAIKGAKKGEGVSKGVRGPVSIHLSKSFDPVEIESIQITKSVNGETPKNSEDGSEKEGQMSPDRMGMRHLVRFGLYEIKGSINVQLAEKTGFSYEDAELVKECLLTLFENDSSAARPDGSMEVVELFWFKHNCKRGQYTSSKVHRSVKVNLKDEVSTPTDIDDYEIYLEPLEGLECERLQ